MKDRQASCRPLWNVSRSSRSPDFIEKVDLIGEAACIAAATTAAVAATDILAGYRTGLVVARRFHFNERSSSFLLFGSAECLDRSSFYLFIQVSKRGGGVLGVAFLHFFGKLHEGGSDVGVALR